MSYTKTMIFIKIMSEISKPKMLTPQNYLSYTNKNNSRNNDTILKENNNEKSFAEIAKRYVFSR